MKPIGRGCVPNAAGAENFRFAEEARFILSEERTFLRGVPEALARQPY
jgi:hypothetical protein